jgi:tRNA (pseudouridine54-N1)-methyltransferase
VSELLRVFILKASEARTSGDFRLKDLPSSSGRLDVVCRCSIASLLDNQQIRNDTIFIAVLEGKPSPPLCLKFDGRGLITVPFSEIGIAAILKRILSERYEIGKEYSVASWAGVSIEKKSFIELMHSNLIGSGLYYLHEKGEDIRNVSFDMGRDNIFVLGDHKGLAIEEEKMLEGLQAKRISVGPLSYLSSQVITLVHDELDKRLPKTKQETSTPETVFMPQG